LVSSITPQEIREGRQIVFETAQQHRRSVEEDHIAVLLEFYIAPDTAQAATRARPFVTRHCPDAPFTEYSALGPGERIIEWIQRYIEAGGCKFVVRPLCPEDETMEQLEMLGRKVLPRFHKK
jgi:alkanesulfonate monooxygenase SsuD/methylene tetrahydromethanopterin reductase-like flavin-dependent oxidoreductase (luciferase family)